MAERSSGSDTDTDKKIELGRVTGVFGVKGWVKVYSDTDPRDNIIRYRQWYLQQANEPWRSVRLSGGHLQGKTVVAHLDGIHDRDAAARLIGAVIAVDRSALPELAEGEYYWTDLIGLRVEDLAGKPLGQVERLFPTGANDVMVVSGDAEILIPWVRDSVIRSVDLANGLITVDWDPEF